MSSTTYRDSEIWKSAMKTAELCCELFAKFSDDDEHDLGFQLQTTAIAIPAAIAEGYGRMHRGSNLKQLSIARGLVMKLETYLILAVRLKCVDKDDVAPAWRQVQHLCNALTTMILTMKKSERLNPNYGRTNGVALPQENEEETDSVVGIEDEA